MFSYEYIFKTSLLKIYEDKQLTEAPVRSIPQKRPS